MRSTEGGKGAIDKARGGAERVQVAMDEAGASTNVATEIGGMRVGQRRGTVEGTGMQGTHWGAMSARAQDAWRRGGAWLRTQWQRVGAALRGRGTEAEVQLVWAPRRQWRPSTRLATQEMQSPTRTA